ncbi:MAG: zinc ribbon domain-containing protein [Deltaproteobacteria bacterium]|nr:zinc ribbon domain-containing protein [Deltaproteobacteria bacterium]
MPTYDYQCRVCGYRFEQQQKISEAPLKECPQCHGEVERLLSGGAGFILKGSGPRSSKNAKDGCSLERTGRTCCGREQRCDTPPCNKG